MRFTAALRQFIAPSKHKMPGREACMRVGTPPLHFYRRLPVKPGNIPPISCSRERSPYDHFKSALSLPPNAVTGTLLLFLLHLPAKFTPFVIPWILFDHIVTNLGEISLYRISAVCFAVIFAWKSRQLSTNLICTYLLLIVTVIKGFL